jgi:hypothetical protein
MLLSPMDGRHRYSESYQEELIWRSAPELRKNGLKRIFKKKEKKLGEGQKAWAEYEANALAVRQKTVRLRALRLSHEERKGEQNSPKNAPASGKRKGRP